MTRRMIAIVGCLIALAMIAAACEQSPTEEQVPRLTTNNVAHQRVIQKMNEMARSLPEGTILSATLPGSRTAKLGAISAPCDSDDTNPEQPYNWELSMWVLSPTGATTLQATDRLVNGWRQNNYDVTERSNGKRLATTGDGDLLTYQISASAQLSLTVESACFPKSQLDTRMSWPERIDATS